MLERDSIKSTQVMACDASVAEFVTDVTGLGDRMTCPKMFGEYGYHLDGVFIALGCLTAARLMIGFLVINPASAGLVTSG